MTTHYRGLISADLSVVKAFDRFPTLRRADRRPAFGPTLFVLFALLALGTGCPAPPSSGVSQDGQESASTESPATRPAEPPLPPSQEPKLAPRSPASEKTAARTEPASVPPPSPAPQELPSRPPTEGPNKTTVILIPTPPPARPADSWVIFREAFKDDQDATCQTEWTGGNRLVVTTDNIKRLTVDLTRLPEGAPRKGPWNLQIDGQGIELTGFAPKEGYTGRIRDLVRSQNGNWEVDRTKLYRGWR